MNKESHLTEETKELEKEFENSNGSIEMSNNNKSSLTRLTESLKSIQKKFINGFEHFENAMENGANRFF